MNEFKVGDWVEFDNSVFCVHKEYNGNRHISEEVANNLANYGKSVTLWHPKESEWCWFWDNFNNPFIGKFVARDGDNYQYKHTKNDKVYSAHKCVPFFGELPSFLKEHPCNQLT